MYGPTPPTDVHAVVKDAQVFSKAHECTRYVNARVRYVHFEIEVTYSHSDWFCSDSSVYRADTDGQGEWL